VRTLQEDQTRVRKSRRAIENRRGKLHTTSPLPILTPPDTDPWDDGGSGRHQRNEHRRQILRERVPHHQVLHLRGAQIRHKPARSFQDRRVHEEPQRAPAAAATREALVGGGVASGTPDRRNLQQFSEEEAARPGHLLRSL
jgi:hypothetical protein